MSTVPTAGVAFGPGGSCPLCGAAYVTAAHVERCVRIGDLMRKLNYPSHLSDAPPRAGGSA
jgi:hypothetical protein